YRDGKHGEPDLLASCYRASLALAASHSVRTIAFPAISCGVYGYPWEDAVRTAVRECTAGLERHAEIERITFACFDDAMLMMYEKAVEQVNERRRGGANGAACGRPAPAHPRMTVIRSRLKPGTPE